MIHKLSKNERLHSKKSIKELFDKGSSFFLYPFKVMVLEINFELPETNQILFSVSKKKLKKSVDRNLIKRRMRESYRLNKQILGEINGGKKIIGLIYVSSEIVTFQVIENKIKKTIIYDKYIDSKSSLAEVLSTKQANSPDIVKLYIAVFKYFKIGVSIFIRGY